MFTFLRAINLKPMEWSTAIAATGSGSPYIGDALETAFAKAKAVVVFMTPDDIAELRPDYASGPHDPDLKPTPQARPNVLLEAGMALGLHPDRTIIVELGTLRGLSDLAGRHTVRIDNSPEKRGELANRLRNAECAVDTSGSDWYSAGDFTAPKVLSGPMGRSLALRDRSMTLIKCAEHACFRVDVDADGVATEHRLLDGSGGSWSAEVRQSTTGAMHIVVGEYELRAAPNKASGWFSGTEAGPNNSECQFHVFRLARVQPSNLNQFRWLLVAKNHRTSILEFPAIAGRGLVRHYLFAKDVGTGVLNSFNFQDGILRASFSLTWLRTDKTSDFSVKSTSDGELYGNSVILYPIVD